MCLNLALSPNLRINLAASLTFSFFTLLSIPFLLSGILHYTNKLAQVDYDDLTEWPR